ncbi:MAG: alpha-1,2-fucosyltransferase [Phycisphaerae bacterium]
MKIISRLQGGLGNQLFQYAAARALGLRLGLQVEFDISALKLDKKRRFELHAFRLPSKLRIASYPDGRRRNPLARWLNPREIVREKHFEYDPDIEKLNARSSIHLIGYWQTEKYFKSVEHEIRRDLEFAVPLDAPNGVMLEKIRSLNAVSVHFRRGDYVNEKHTADYHGVPSMKYYHNSVEAILEGVPDAMLFIFSDDPGWVRDHFHPRAPVTIVDINTPDQPAADLRLMAACKHHILANSSFSWWGAWLNPNRDKMVVAPSRWFSGATSNTVDLLPPQWRALEAD